MIIRVVAIGKCCTPKENKLKEISIVTVISRKNFFRVLLMTQNYNMLPKTNNIVIDESAELQREVERDHPRKLSLRHPARKAGHTAG